MAEQLQVMAPEDDPVQAAGEIQPGQFLAALDLRYMEAKRDVYTFVQGKPSTVPQCKILQVSFLAGNWQKGTWKF